MRARAFDSDLRANAAQASIDRLAGEVRMQSRPPWKYVIPSARFATVLFGPRGTPLTQSFREAGVLHIGARKIGFD